MPALLARAGQWCGHQGWAGQPAPVPGAWRPALHPGGRTAVASAAPALAAPWPRSVASPTHQATACHGHAPHGHAHGEAEAGRPGPGGVGRGPLSAPATRAGRAGPYGPRRGPTGVAARPVGPAPRSGQPAHAPGVARLAYAARAATRCAGGVARHRALPASTPRRVPRGVARHVPASQVRGLRTPAPAGRGGNPVPPRTGHRVGAGGVATPPGAAG